MNARGSDVFIRVMVDGEEILGIGGIREASWDPGIEVDEDEYLGDDRPTIDGVNGAERLELTNTPTSSQWQTLVDYQQRKNDGDPDMLEMVINVSFTVDHHNSDRARRLLPDCTLSGGGVSFSGRKEKVTQNPVFTCAKGKVIS